MNSSDPITHSDPVFNSGSRLTQEERDILVLKAMPMIHKIARSIRSKYWGSFSKAYEDRELVQEGATAALRCAERYDTSKGGFCQYIYLAVRGSMEDLFRRKNAEFLKYSSLDHPCTPTSHKEMIQHTSLSPNQEELAEKAIQRQKILNALELIPEKERIVISEYFFGGQTQRQISAMIGLSYTRVCDLSSSGIESLRKAIGVTAADDAVTNNK